MVFRSIKGRLLKRSEKTLPRLNLWIHLLRLLEFLCTTTFLGLFLHFVSDLPYGFEISGHMTAVYAMSIVAALYPVLMWSLWLITRYFKRTVLCIKISRTTDTMLIAPLMIALAVVLGNGGLPANCDGLHDFDKAKYAASKNITVEAPCNVTEPTNVCGTGRQQVEYMDGVCVTARAGFSLVIVTIVTLYAIIALTNLYLYHKPRDNFDPNDPRAHRRGGSLASEMSESTQRLNAAFLNGNTPEGPPPPYTSRPGRHERAANTEEVRRSGMMLMIANQMTAPPPAMRVDRTSTGTADHPVFSPGRTDSVLEDEEEDIERVGRPTSRTVRRETPRLVNQASSAALSSRASTIRSHDDGPPSPMEGEEMPFVTRAADMPSSPPRTVRDRGGSRPVSPISPIDDLRNIEGALALRTFTQDPPPPSQRISPPQSREASRARGTSRVRGLRESARPSRGSWGYSITVMMDERDAMAGSDLQRNGSNASAPAGMEAER